MINERKNFCAALGSAFHNFQCYFVWQADIAKIAGNVWEKWKILRLTNY